MCHSLKLLRVQVSFERLRVHRTILRGAEQCGWRVLLLLLDRHRLGEITRLVDIATKPHGHVVGEQLQRDDCQ